MDATKRPNLFVVEGNGVIIPDPTEEQLLALAAERVSGNVSPQEFLDYPDVREAMVALFKKQELVKAETLLAAEKAAKREVLESARYKLMAELAQDAAGSVPVVPAVVEATETVAISDKTVIAKPPTPLVPVQEPMKSVVAVRPPMPELKQGEVLSDHRALGIIGGEKDPTGISFPRFSKPDDLKRYQDPNSGNWWCMVTGRLFPDNMIRVVGAVLVCEKSHAERLANKLGQHPYSIVGTLDWLNNKAKMLDMRAKQVKLSVSPMPKKSPERVAEEEKIRATVAEINSMEKLVSDGLRLLHMHQPDCWQFRCTQAMLSNIASGLITEFEAELPERFQNRGDTAELQKELDSVLEKKRASSEKSFESFIFHRLAGVLIRHREALQRPMAAPGSVSRKKRPDKAAKLVRHARSLGIDPNGKSDVQLRSLISAHEKAKSRRQGSKPQHGRRS